MTIADDRIDTHRSAWGLDLPVELDPWKRRAVCAQTDPEAFFPEKGGSTRDAKRICLGCEVQAECLQAALDNDERFGIWGGMSERERRRLKRGEPVVRSLTSKPNRRPNGHGHACKCVECRP
jgi:WhiB family redox-sensing transcriptional regulator